MKYDITEEHEGGRVSGREGKRRGREGGGRMAWSGGGGRSPMGRPNTRYPHLLAF